LAAGYTTVLGVLLTALPPNPDAIEVPATLIWRFRLASLAGSLTLWTITSLSFGWLCIGWPKFPSRVRREETLDRRPV
jgi:hypothetical protein